MEAIGDDLNAWGNNALFLASARGHIGVVHVLLAAGIGVHGRGSYALVLALENGHAEVVRVLLASGGIEK